MATVSAKFSGAGLNGVNGASWNYAVPLDSEEIATQPTYPANPTSLASSSSTNNRSFAVQDPNSESYGQGKVAANRTPRLARKRSDLSGRKNSDGSSDNFKSQNRSRNASSSLENGSKRKAAAQNGDPADDNEEGYWIHRDKLAAIESRELEEAGFIPASKRSQSRAAYDASYEQDLVDEHGYDASYHDHQNPLYHDGDGDGDLGEYELRRPEEVASENAAIASQYIRPLPRLSGSKLPVKRSGTTSGSASPPERDSPLAKARSLSGHHSGIPEPRERSKSIASQNRLAHDGISRPETPPLANSTTGSSDKENSPIAPTRPPAATKTTPRKASASKNVPKAKRLASGSANGKGDSPTKVRPGTSSGGPRPSTSSHRPEGEAPWIASMYKPDPRLPPDQQMLPTHARRLAQEQWEKDGKLGTVYDKDFRLLNTTALPNPRLSQRSTDTGDLQIERTTSHNDSPIKTTVLSSKWSLHELGPGSPRSPASTRPGTSGTEHGGYKVMPAIQGPATPTHATAQKPFEPVRVQEPDEKDEAKKAGCCGCTIM